MKIKRFFALIVVFLIVSNVSNLITDGANYVASEDIYGIEESIDRVNETEDYLYQKTKKETDQSEIQVCVETAEDYYEIEEYLLESSFEVHYIDVGQADATLIICDNEYMLIDGGNVEDSSLIYSYLREHGVEQLNYMICTHAHEDHVGGLSGALNYAKVNTVFAPTTNYDSDAFRNFVKHVNLQGKEIIVPTVEEEFMLGSSKCIILASNTIPDDANNSSIVLKIEYGDTSFLFCGDIEQVIERMLVESYSNLKSTVLKVPHHGSDTSLSYRFLNEVLPEYGVISVGKNSYGHPTDAVLSKLKDADVKVYRTDFQGDIICKSDGINVEFIVQKESDIDVFSTRSGEKESSLYTDQSTLNGYIINLNTEKFHYSSCYSVDRMKEYNKKYVESTREELISQGYSPCGNCNP